MMRLRFAEVSGGGWQTANISWGALPGALQGVSQGRDVGVSLYR